MEYVPYYVFGAGLVVLVVRMLQKRRPTGDPQLARLEQLGFQDASSEEATVLARVRDKGSHRVGQQVHRRDAPRNQQCKSEIVDLSGSERAVASSAKGSGREASGGVYTPTTSWPDSRTRSIASRPKAACPKNAMRKLTPANP